MYIGDLVDFSVDGIQMLQKKKKFQNFRDDRGTKISGVFSEKCNIFYIN